jgi:hypothetical protein
MKSRMQGPNLWGVAGSEWMGGDSDETINEPSSVEGDGRLAGVCNAARLPSASLLLPCVKPITASMGTANPASTDAAPSLRVMRLVTIPNSALCESTSGPPPAPTADRSRELPQPESLPGAGYVVCEPQGCDGSLGGARRGGSNWT